MNYTEFIKFKNNIVNKKSPRKIKISNSWGVCDCYRDIRKHHWYDIERPLKPYEFYSIIRSVNKLLAKELAEGNTITFPAKMGKLELRKYKPGVKFKKGKLKNTYPIDWMKTLQLWYEDDEARINKTLVRSEVKDFFYIHYNTYKVDYSNKCYYEFALNRFIKRDLLKNIVNGDIDTLW